MNETPRIWIADDAELSNVREWITEAGLEFGEGVAPADAHIALLISSARRTLTRKQPLPSASTHVVVYEDTSRSLRKVLQRSGCDVVMRHPIDPHAFRLLLNYALYAGPEKRRSRRALVSSPVEILQGRERAPARLVSLSLRGCGLVANTTARVGSEIRVRLPRALTGTADLDLEGHVLSHRTCPSGGGHDVAVGFRPMEVAVRRALHAIMEDASDGAELRPRTGTPALQPVAESGDGERRRTERKTFTRRVLAAGAGIAHVLIGCDLSAGGMRVRPDPDLEKGDTLKLALHGRPGQPALMVKAVVDRDDGVDGVVLRFLEVPPSIARRIEELVAALPALPIRRDAGRPAPATILTEVLSRR